MELLETQDPEKRKLIETSNRHRQELEREATDISDRTQNMLKNALIIGGALALTYVVVNQLTHRKSKKKKTKVSTAKEIQSQESGEALEEEDSTPSILSEIGNKVAGAATVFLLDMAKEKIADYLKNPKSKDENS